MASQNCRIVDDSSSFLHFDEPEFYDDFCTIDRSRARRDNAEDNVARDHPHYHNPIVGPDGLFHCPWENMDPPCSHRPEKLKCNYEYENLLFCSEDQTNQLSLFSKYVDSHLKPYRCKVPACGDSRFSSTACLLRHEREAHAMHGHGEKPFLCTAEGCERAQPGFGFPRHWNLRDHMKRVHGCIPEPADSDQPVRGTRKRKSESSNSGSKKKSPSTPPKENVAPVELTLKEQFQETRRQLLDSVQCLDDPSDPEALNKLRIANNFIKEMATTSQRMTSVPKMKRSKSQESG
jgi:hypothetical protein